MSRHRKVPDEKAPRELLFCYLYMQLKYRDGWVAEKNLVVGLGVYLWPGAPDGCRQS